MANYYDEVLQDIAQLMDEGRDQEAMGLVTNELKMPYIPAEAEKQLKKLERDLQYRLTDRREVTEPSLDTILDHLKGKPEMQLAAASQLAKRNLRECLPFIKSWLASDPFAEAGAFVVEAIAEQSIGDEFVWNRNGVEYSFYGDGITPAPQSAGFKKAEEELKDWLANDDPDMYEMARMMLIHEVFMFLPLSYEEEEGRELALEMVKKVSDMMDDGAVYQKIVEQEKKKAAMN